jgi:hypothetical protein
MGNACWHCAQDLRPWARATSKQPAPTLARPLSLKLPSPCTLSFGTCSLACIRRSQIMIHFLLCQGQRLTVCVPSAITRRAGRVVAPVDIIGAATCGYQRHLKFDSLFWPSSASRARSAPCSRPPRALMVALTHQQQLLGTSAGSGLTIG